MRQKFKKWSLALLSLTVCAPAVIAADVQTAAVDQGVSAKSSASTSKSDTLLNDLFVQQWVRAGDDGKITGTVSELVSDSTVAMPGSRVALVQAGKTIQVADVNAKGEFSFSGVKVGSYSLIAKNEESLAAFALNVLSGESNKHLPSSIDVRVVRPTGQKVKEILRAQILPVFNPRVEGQEKPVVDSISSERTFAPSHVVLADEQGQFVGQVAKSGVAVGKVDMSDMTLFITKDGEEVARSAVNADGTFAVAGLKPGNYGMLVAGNEGFAAVAFQLVDDKLVQEKNAEGRFVSRRGHHACCSRMHVECINPCDVPVCEQPVVHTQQVIETVAAPVSEVVVDGCGVAPACGCGCGGGFGGGYGGGGFGGGGGGFGGGFGGGGLIGLAGLGAIAAAIASNDDPNNNGVVFVPQPVVSPIQ